MAADPQQGPAGMPGGMPPNGGPPPEGPPPGMLGAEMQHDVEAPPAPGPSLEQVTEAMAQACLSAAQESAAAPHPPDTKEFAQACMFLAQGISALNPPMKPVDPNLHDQTQHKVLDIAHQAMQQAQQQAHETRMKAQEHAQQLEQQQAQAEQAQAAQGAEGGSQAGS